ncbi:MAG: sigma factor-like helix-turn-helix DNA-binding protein [Patescibacteria group bacterium]
MNEEQESSILDKIISEQSVSHLLQFDPKDALQELLSLLSEREKQVLIRRFGLEGGIPETLEKIGQSFQVTRERVRQIERQAIQKLRTGNKSSQAVKLFKEVIVEILEKEGGIIPLSRFESLMSEYGKGMPRLAIEFLLNEVLTDLVVPLGGDNSEFVTGWRLRTANQENLLTLIDKAEEIVSQQSKPINSQELSSSLLSAGLADPLNQPIASAELALSLLSMSRRVKQNPFGDWGLSHWETITPKRMNDKIYLVLKRAGRPLHFREIVRLINEQKFDNKTAYAPTVHNELILDKKYVLVGRGIYALKEWGFKPGVVADVLIRTLQEKGPLILEELVAEVLKKRFVKKGTIQLALTNREKFKRLPDGRYDLANNSSDLNQN